MACGRRRASCCLSNRLRPGADVAALARNARRPINNRPQVTNLPHKSSRRYWLVARIMGFKSRLCLPLASTLTGTARASYGLRNSALCGAPLVPRQATRVSFVLAWLHVGEIELAVGLREGVLETFLPVGAALIGNQCDVRVVDRLAPLNQSRFLPPDRNRCRPPPLRRRKDARCRACVSISSPSPRRRLLQVSAPPGIAHLSADAHLIDARRNFRTGERSIGRDFGLPLPGKIGGLQKQGQVP